MYTQPILPLKYCFQKNFIFENFIKFYLIIFNLINIFFFENLFYNEQCSFSNSGKIPSQTGSKQAECTKCTARWPSCTPRPRPGRPDGRAPLACLPRASSACLPAARAYCAPAQCPPAARAPLARAPARLARPAPQRPAPVRPLAPRPLTHAACAVPACRAPCLRALCPAQP